MTAWEVVAMFVGVVVTILVPAMGWLITEVIRHRAEIEAIRVAVEERRDIREKLEALLTEVSRQVAAAHGAVEKLDERTNWIKRAVDRQERFLDLRLTETLRSTEGP